MANPIGIGWDILSTLVKKGGKEVLEAAEKKVVNEAEQEAVDWSNKTAKEVLEDIAKGRGIKPGQTPQGAYNNWAIEQAAKRKALKSANKGLNPGRIRTLHATTPTWIKAAIPMGVVGGGLWYGSRGGSSDGSIPEGFTLGGTGTGYGSTGRTAEDIAAEYEAQRQMLEQMYGQLKPNFPGQEMYDPLTALTTQLAGQSSGAMSDLANQYANTAADIKQTGVEGAASINDIYGKGAAQMEDVAAQAGGQYGGMIPVSGAEALAPGQQKELGASLANYLQQNQLINAQTQGGMAELAQLMGPAYANQYALMDAQMRAQAEANKAMRMSDYMNAMQEQRANALMELALQEMRDKQALRLEEQQRGEAMNIIASPANIKQYMSEWEALDDSEKAYYANNFGIKTPEDFIRFQLYNASKYGQSG